VRVDPTLVRSGQWWDHKMPQLVAAAALCLLPASGSLDGPTVLLDLVLFLVAAVGVAAFGHVLNDLADIRTDALAGVNNQMAGLDVPQRAAVLGVTVAAGGLPWLVLPTSARTLALLATEVVLLTIYSLPPLRLKDRAAAGVVADALYAYVVPILLTISVFTDLGGVPWPAWWITVPVSTWMLLMGLRGILWHQIGDLAHDRRAGVRTFVTGVGADRAGSVVGGLVVVELLAAAASIATIAVATGQRWLPVFGVLYLTYRIFQVTILWTEPLHWSALGTPNGRIRYVGYVLLNEFVERWIPIAALIALAVQIPLLWIAVVVHVLAFDNAVTEFLRRDLPSLPDAVNRLAHERRSRRNIRLLAERRRAAQARGPARLDPSVQQRCRWVFVVCGPELHVETLATAVRNLRPLTSLEIWVVTDSTRNVRPIEVDGVDRVVDVTTPEHLDDHQASIWLKTGVHRHVSSGEWCYLDSDIIAVRPGMEAVFNHRSGPVAFASDLTISANQVDRFSPWAMTCDCSGHGEEHSCGHLREQLAERFGLDVPGDWVHWNGGVFLFGDDSATFLDMWHERAVSSFEWPEWRTRDQGALISTVWTLGQQDAERIPPEFNFIADLGNGDLCLDPDRGWALHPAGPWHEAFMLHLYTSRLEDPSWDLGRDVEAPVVRQTLVRTVRWKRYEVKQRAVDEYWSAKEGWARRRAIWAQSSRDAYWAVRSRVELLWLRIRRQPQRLRPTRIAASVARRRSSDSAS
jgi:4-hydroxybenzoate polyprenyltransferase